MLSCYVPAMIIRFNVLVRIPRSVSFRNNTFFIAYRRITIQHTCILRSGVGYSYNIYQFKIYCALVWTLLSQEKLEIWCKTVLNT